MIEKSISTTALHDPLNSLLDDDLRDSVSSFLKSLSVSRCFSSVILEDLFIEKAHLNLICFSFLCLWSIFQWLIDDRIFGD